MDLWKCSWRALGGLKYVAWSLLLQKPFAGVFLFEIRPILVFQHCLHVSGQDQQALAEALMWASEDGSAEVVELLFRLGLDLSVPWPADPATPSQPHWEGLCHELTTRKGAETNPARLLPYSYRSKGFFSLCLPFLKRSCD